MSDAQTDQLGAWAAFDGPILDESACPNCLGESCDGTCMDASKPADPQPANAQLLHEIRDDEPAPVAIIEGVAYADCVSVLVAESGAGKTFVGLGFAAAVSDGVAWHGRDVQLGTTVYFAYEGDAMSLRRRALREVQRYRAEHLRIFRGIDPVSPTIDRDRAECPSLGEQAAAATLDALAGALAREQRPPIRLCIVDTVRASLAGSEDSSEHVAAYLRAVRRLMTHTPGAAWILIHHAGWQDGQTGRQRERGSSAWRGNADATFYLEAGEFDRDRGEAALTLKGRKLRDTEIPPPLYLIRRRVEIPGLYDRHGRPVTSCIIERDRRTLADVQAEQVRQAQAQHLDIDRRVLAAIRDQALTTQMQVRAFVGGRHADVVESIGRVVQAGWVAKPRQRHPYTLTEAGRAQLA